VFSIGDVLIGLGVVVVIAVGMHGSRGTLVQGGTSPD
jgi:hypothetical protein